MGLLTDKTPPKRDSLEEYFADDAATEALALLKTDDPDAARDALLLVAGYVQRGEALPGNLAHYLADAIDASMGKATAKARAKALTNALGLTAENRRPAGDWAEIGGKVERIYRECGSEEIACGAVADSTGVSDRTVRRYWDKYKEQAALFDAAMK